jgi:6-phosphogluconolactonase
MTLPTPRPALAVALALCTAATAAADHWVYFGTYTGGKGATPSKGIYRSKLDAAGKLSAPELAAEMGSPSFLAAAAPYSHLYAVGEGGGKDGGPVVAFGLDGKTGALTKINEVLSGGAGPCHVFMPVGGGFLTVANYGGGSTAVFRLNIGGGIGNRLGFFQHAGSSVNPARQKEPHAHCSVIHPSGEAIFTVDLGIDKVKAFKFSEQRGVVTEDPARDFVMPAGSGPRHMAIDTLGTTAYVCGELDSTVNVVSFDLKAGTHKVVQSLSTLPAPHKGNSTAECVLHPSGKFVYVSNRGHNSVAVFKVGGDKKLTAAGHITGDIKTPRNFNIDPTGKWMLIASQDGDKVGVWELDPATGTGKETGTTVAVGRPVCVKFVPVAK